MHISNTFRLACLAGALAFSLNAQASPSSASSAGSASSGSVSDSLGASSKSSTGDNKTADGAYHIINIAQTPDRDGMTRVTMQGDEAGKSIVLDLPTMTFARQNLDKGDVVYAQNREYGIEFARNDTREAFFLVLANDWHGELAARPVTI